MTKSGDRRSFVLLRRRGGVVLIELIEGLKVTAGVDAWRPLAVQGMDHDGLGIEIGRGVSLPRQGKRTTLGGFVGFEPLVQLPVRCLQGLGQGVDSFRIGGRPVPCRTENRDHVVERLQPRLILRTRPRHELVDVLRQAPCPRPALGGHSGSAIEAASFNRDIAVDRLGIRRWHSVPEATDVSIAGG